MGPTSTSVPSAANARPSRTYWLAFGFLLLTVIAAFWQYFFTAQVPFYRDVAFAHYPRSFELRTLLRQGQLPLWNTFEHFGESVIANPNYLLFYPTTWLAWVLPFNYGFKLHYALHFVVLAAGSFLLARRSGLSPFACYLAGAFFLFSGPVMSLGNFSNVLAATAWIPLVMLAADRQAERGGWRATAVLSASLAIQLFAGEPLISILTTGLALGWVIFLHGDLRLRFWTGSNRRLAGHFFLALVFAGGLAALQLLPALAHLPVAERTTKLEFSEAFTWSLHPLKLLEMLLPGFFGNAFFSWRLPWIYMEGAPSFLLSVFVGIVPLALAFLAALTRRERAARFWVAAAIAALVLALGRFTSFSLLLYYVIPLFRILRFPAKFLPAFALAVAQLSAMAVDYLLQERQPERDQRRLRFTAAGGCLLAVAWLLLSALVLLAPGPAKRAARGVAGVIFDHALHLRVRQSLELSHGDTVERAAIWLVQAIPRQLPYVILSTLLLVAIAHPTFSRTRPGRLRLHRALVWLTGFAALEALLFTTYSLNPLVSPRFYSDPPPVLRSLRNDPGPVRFFAEAPLSPPNLPSPAFLKQPAELEFLPPAAQIPYVLRMSLQINAGTLGLENSFSPNAERILPVYHALFNDIVCLQKLAPPRLLVKLLAVSGVEYAVLWRLRLAPGSDFVPAGVFENGTVFPVRLFRVAEAVPRAYLVPASRALVVPSGLPALNRLASPDFDPRRQVLLHQAARSGAHPPAPEGAAGDAGEAKILRHEALRVEVQTRAREPSYLVLADTYSADWQVIVDASPAPLLRANQMFRAVPVPPGTHRVIFRYRPATLFWGVGITLATLVALSTLTAGKKAGGSLPHPPAPAHTGIGSGEP